MRFFPLARYYSTWSGNYIMDMCRVLTCRVIFVSGDLMRDRVMFISFIRINNDELPQELQMSN